MTTTSSIRLDEENIRDRYREVSGFLTHAEADDKAPAAPAQGFVSAAPAGSSASRRTVVNLDKVLRAGSDDQMMPPERYGLLYETRRALAVGFEAATTFVAALGFEDLGRRNQQNTLHGKDLESFQSLVRARAIVTVFATAAHLAHIRKASPSGEPSSPGPVPTGSTSEAVSWFVHRLAGAIETADAPGADVDAAVARVCADVMDRCETDAHVALGDLARSFASVSYAVEADGFHLRGFERPSGGARRKALTMTFKQPSEVVGNHLAKAQAMRLAKMLACYDVERRSNPFVDLGGFLFTFVGDGFPGTGKTTLIQMTAGLINGYCETAGIPFHYENFGVDQISEYQGKSAQNCRAFVDRVLDPSGIGFGTIDDVDQVAGKRDDRQSSSGALEVTAALMEAFAGANTVVRGNATFGMFSNYPEKVDDALRQRAGARWLVDGPQSRADYIDIFSLLVGRNHKIPPGEHDFFAAQEIARMVAASYEAHSLPHEDRLLAVWERYSKAHGAPKTLADVGSYLHAIKEAEPSFTGRAVKNVADAIKYRAMESVELPDEWFATAEAFMRKPYEEKLAMIEALRQPVTMEMVLQEINRYADSEFRYAGKSDDAAIDAMVRDMGLREQAIARFEARKGDA